jgi:hypothetical protein
VPDREDVFDEVAFGTAVATLLAQMLVRRFRYSK